MSYKIFEKQFLKQFFKCYSTPCYIYDTNLLRDTIHIAKTMCVKYFGQNTVINYALKANDNLELLSEVKNAGLGIDCVSGGEIELAIACGFEGSQIVFAGVGKQDWEIELGITARIHAFNCESIQEVYVIGELAKKHGKKVNIMLRVNPDIDAKTHKHISTGTYDNKFGITFQDICNFIPILKSLNTVNLIGLHYHVGSQITDMEVFAQLGSEVSRNYKKLSELGCALSEVDLGGGLGVNYINPQEHPIADFNDYFAIFKKHLNLSDSIKVHFELGRSLVAQCGVILSKVLYVKNTSLTNFAIIDAGMNDLMRPALYGAKHLLMSLESKNSVNKYHVVGPVCESTDIFARDIILHTLERGDVIVILTCGAYGRVLANQYNRRHMIKEYVI